VQQTLCKPYGAASDAFMGKAATMLSHDLIVAPTQSRPPAIIEGSGRKARVYDRREDRVTHHRGFWPKQLMAVWSLLLQNGSEGSSFIFRTARR
jgi:hypothetical protein